MSLTCQNRLWLTSQIEYNWHFLTTYHMTGSIHLQSWWTNVYFYNCLSTRSWSSSPAMLWFLVNKFQICSCSHYIDLKSNIWIYYHRLAHRHNQYHTIARHVMYLISWLTMEETVINLLHSVRKCGLACYPPSVIRIALCSAPWDRDDLKAGYWGQTTLTGCN